MQELVGRQHEILIMADLLSSDEAEMLAITGRRRIGKTFLVERFYEKEICFALTGTQYGSMGEQLENFAQQLGKYANATTPVATPKSWQDAFHQLAEFVEKKKFKQKKVLFFDEIPWLATHKSKFLQSLGYFWNTWASKQNIIVVICGSAASWMIDKVISNKGGLHNRVTRQISLQAFTLAETSEYLQSRKIKLTDYQIAQIYMVSGGVPFYLKQLQAGKSAVQNIDDICFKKDGLLKNEFDNLYPALFEKASNHIAIVRALASKWKGLTRKEVVEISKLPDGGSITKYLIELEYSGFINSYQPFGKSKKDILYRLTDEYSLFYLKFIEAQKTKSWAEISQSQKWKSWSGYAFESLCLKHSERIKQALGISGISSQEASFVFHGNENHQGFQIDLLIDRQDQCINLCEMKFYESQFIITKEYALKLRERIALFKSQTKTKKQVFVTMISTFGLQKNRYSLDIIDQDFDMEILF